MNYRLPISGQEVCLRAPLGGDDFLLVETSLTGLELQKEIAQRLARPIAEGVHWLDLPAADLDAALLALRASLRGDCLLAEIDCPRCGAKGDLSFRISDYLSAHQPGTPKGVTPQGQGWFSMNGWRFRVPSVGLVLECRRKAASHTEAASLLESACLAEVNKQGLRRARQALQRLAPLLCDELAGQCPHCGAAQTAWFEPGEFVLAELRQEASAIYEEVHLLASRYGWSEEVILAMPTSRRLRYAEMIADDLRWERERAYMA
ncbi:hypothetical protein AAU61_13155 [Desulfocarbo indianensis]|nr:hypothetical protein AAU61_13155 [Desulfocarbo indianensis]